LDARGVSFTMGAVQVDFESEIGTLHKQYAGTLVRFAFTFTADQEVCHDAVQEAFLRYFIERRYGRSIVNPRAWLYQVVRNYLLDRKKSAAVGQEVAVEQADALPAKEANPHEMVERRDTVREISAALTARELECLRLRSEGLSYEEIGTTLFISPGTVAALLARAHTKLRTLSRKGTGWTFASTRGALIHLALQTLPDSY
jgi:RNA polymerase sigma-70 factor, ECF subfamily